MSIIFDVAGLIVILLAAYFLIKIISAPLRLIFKLLINAAGGLIILFLLNRIAGMFGDFLEINLLSCLLAGVFGFPGVIAVVIIQFLL